MDISPSSTGFQPESVWRQMAPHYSTDSNKDTNTDISVPSYEPQRCSNSSEVSFPDIYIQAQPEQVAVDDYAKRIKIVRTSRVPKIANGVLIVFIKNNAYLRNELFNFDWRDETAYCDVEKSVQELLIRKIDPKAVSYKKAGRVRLLEITQSQITEKDSVTVREEREWGDSVPNLVNDYCAADKETPFFVEIRLEYDWILVPEPAQGQSFSQCIKAVLEENVSQASKMIEDEEPDKEWYWSRNTVRHIFTRKNIERLIEEDRDLCHDSAWTKALETEQRALVEFISEGAQRLTAAMVWCGLSLLCVYRLYRYQTSLLKRSEENSSIRPLDLSEPLSLSVLRRIVDSSGKFSNKVHIFSKCQGDFLPMDFLRSVESGKKSIPDHIKVLSDVVVPVRVHGKRIGKGAFGSVYCVSIPGDHHEFTTNKDQKFALKVLFRRGQQKSEDIDKETRVLNILSKLPHDHITSYLASWTQRNVFHMLFPLAEGNLDSLLRTDSTPCLSGSHIQWLLEQMEGLVQAVCHIHYLGRAAMTQEDIKDSGGNRRKIQSGYHHDLKPQNILVFRENGRLRLKIADFGTAHISEIVSGKSYSGSGSYVRGMPAGDAIYCAPDRKVKRPKDGQVYCPGRKSDIWSMGCIFLEMILWTFGRGGEDLDRFYEARKLNRTTSLKKALNETQDPVQRLREEHTTGLDLSAVDTPSSDSDQDRAPVRDPAARFWFLNPESSEPEIATEVKRQFSWLSKRTKNRSILRSLCKLTEEMLCINPEQRPYAATIQHKIGSLRVRAKVKFDQDGDGAYQTDDNVPEHDTCFGYSSAWSRSDSPKRRDTTASKSQHLEVPLKNKRGRARSSSPPLTPTTSHKRQSEAVSNTGGLGDDAMDVSIPDDGDGIIGMRSRAPSLNVQPSFDDGSNGIAGPSDMYFQQLRDPVGLGDLQKK